MSHVTPDHRENKSEAFLKINVVYCSVTSFENNKQGLENVFMHGIHNGVIFFEEVKKQVK